MGETAIFRRQMRRDSNFSILGRLSQSESCDKGMPSQPPAKQEEKFLPIFLSGLLLFFLFHLDGELPGRECRGIGRDP